MSRFVQPIVDAIAILVFCTLMLFPWSRWFGGEVIQLSQMLQPPSGLHPLGTDNLGRDLLGRISSSIQSGILPLWVAAIVACILGFVLGGCTLIWSESSFGRLAAKIVGGICTVLTSIPVGISAFAAAVIWHKAGLLPIALVLGVMFTLRVVLEVRGFYEIDCRKSYWSAHEALGGRLSGRIWRYGACSGWNWKLGKLLSSYMIVAVAIEASLSYLGFGVQEPQASLGNMLASHFDLYLKGHWYILVLIVATLSLAAYVPGAVWRLADRGRLWILKPSKTLRLRLSEFNRQESARQAKGWR